MSKNSKIVIIGGGAIGLSVAYHLGKLGCDRVVLLEKNTLTSGTSWHAAGIVGPLRGSQNLTVLAKYAGELFRRLEDETGLSTGYRQTGGMWLAQDPARMIELKRIAAMGMMNGLNAELISRDQIKARFDLMHVDDLRGGLWVDEDAHVNPVDLCMAYGRGARSAGVTIRENAGVKNIEVKNGKVNHVVLENEEMIACDMVINCAGLWARQIGQLVGVHVPLQAVEHIYVVTEAISKLPNPCPVVRDLDSGIYLKEDAGKLVLGAFESNPKLWFPDSVDGNHSFLTLDEDWDHAEPMLSAGMHRLPCLSETGIVQFMNGPESFTPDTKQVMGRSSSVTNFFVAAGFNSIGIMSSAGVGKVMAHWMVNGYSPMDLWEVDLNRFDSLDNDSAFLAQRIPESVHNQFHMHWPFKQNKTGRNKKQSVWHEKMASLGAVFGAPTGWERPLWFVKEGEDNAIRYSHDAQNWWPMAARESMMLQEYGALFELSPFTKLSVSGPDSLGYLQRICSNDVDIATGKIVYTLMLNGRGGIEGEVTIIRQQQTQFLVVSGAATRVKDLGWLSNRVLETESVTLLDVTDDYAVLGVMGPNSRDLLEQLSGEDLSDSAWGFGVSRTLNIGPHSVQASRLSYVGELGWELFISVDVAVGVLEIITDVMDDYGMGMAGHFCLECCRLEKRYLHWGSDIGPEENPYEAGLGWSVKVGKAGGFIGESAIDEIKNVTAEKQLLLFEVVGGRPLLLGDEPIFCNDQWVGQTSSGGIGFRITGDKPERESSKQNKGIALCLGYVTTHSIDQLALENGNSDESKYTIEVAGERFNLVVLEKSPYDPAGLKMRS